MQDNEFQRPLSRSQFQLTCSRENCIRNVSSKTKLVDLGRRNDYKSPWRNPSISAYFHCAKSCFCKLIFVTLLSNILQTIMYYFPEKGWLNESLENNSK